MFILKQNSSCNRAFRDFPAEHLSWLLGIKLISRLRHCSTFRTAILGLQTELLKITEQKLCRLTCSLILLPTHIYLLIATRSMSDNSRLQHLFGGGLNS